MSKSVYDEALEIVDESLYQQDNSVIFNHLGLNLLKKSLEQAQKQEKLLNKIKEIIDRQDDSYISSMLEESQRYYEIKELMIKELENE